MGSKYKNKETVNKKFLRQCYGTDEEFFDRLYQLKDGEGLKMVGGKPMRTHAEEKWGKNWFIITYPYRRIKK